MQLRKALPQDAAAIRALTRAAYAKWVPLIGREPMPMTVDYDRAVQERGFDLLFAHGRLIALIETILHPDHLFIENVAVAPEEQGRGLGHRLLEHAERMARAADLPELRLLTNQAFEANIRLYRSIGFRIDRTEPFSGGGVTVYMSKPVER